MIELNYYEYMYILGTNSMFVILGIGLGLAIAFYRRLKEILKSLEDGK